MAPLTIYSDDVTSKTIPPAGALFYLYAPYLISGFFSNLATGFVWSAISGYFARYPKDSWYSKAFVLGALTTAQSMLICYNIVEIAAIHIGEVSFVITKQFDGTAWVRTIIAALIAFLTQSFMIYRFMTFFKALSFDRTSPANRRLYWFSVALLMGLALAGLILGVAIPIYLSTLPDPSQAGRPTTPSHNIYKWMWNTQLILHLILDVSLTLFFSLKLERARTGFARSNRIIDVLMLVLIRNGLLMTLLQLASMILYLINNRYSIWLTLPLGLISKIYVLTVLAILTKPRDTQDIMNGSTSNRFAGPGIVDAEKSTSDSSCQSCRKRLRDSGKPVSKAQSGGKSSKLTFSEFLKSGDDDDQGNSLEIAYLDKGNGGLTTTANYRQGDVDFRLEEDQQTESRGNLSLVVQIEKEEEVFVSPSDYSPQATRQPRLGVMGGQRYMADNDE